MLLGQLSGSWWPSGLGICLACRRSWVWFPNLFCQGICFLGVHLCCWSLIVTLWVWKLFFFFVVFVFVFFDIMAFKEMQTVRKLLWTVSASHRTRKEPIGKGKEIIQSYHMVFSYCFDWSYTHNWQYSMQSNKRSHLFGKPHIWLSHWNMLSALIVSFNQKIPSKVELHIRGYQNGRLQIRRKRFFNGRWTVPLDRECVGIVLNSVLKSVRWGLSDGSALDQPLTDGHPSRDENNEIQKE